MPKKKINGRFFATKHLFVSHSLDVQVEGMDLDTARCNEGARCLFVKECFLGVTCVCALACVATKKKSCFQGNREVDSALVSLLQGCLKHLLSTLPQIPRSCYVSLINELFRGGQ